MIKLLIAQNKRTGSRPSGSLIVLCQLFKRLASKYRVTRYREKQMKRKNPQRPLRQWS